MLLQALNLIAERSECTFIYIGASKYAGVGEFLRQSLGDKVINLAGKTTLREMCAVMAQTSMYIGADTGTMHIAAALKLPVIELSHEAADYEKTHLSMCTRFSPWQTPTMILNPPHALEPCCNQIPRGGCSANAPHCITLITPASIANAFEVMRNLTYNSR